MDTPARVRQRLVRGATACQRCRRRKQKCDLKHPSCSNCESAKAQCLTFHSAKQVEIPRDYVSNLESQVEKLTREIQELRTRNLPASVNGENVAPSTPSPASRELGIEPSPERPATSDGSSRHLQDLVNTVKDVVVEPSRQPRFLGQSSGITLAKMVMAAVRVDSLTTPLSFERRSHDWSSSAPTAEASLPPRQAADHLVQVYFQYRTPHLPIIERSHVKEAVDHAYRHLSIGSTGSSDRVAERHMFTAYMIFAIALYDVPTPSGGRPSQSEGCFRSAIGWLESVITYSQSDLHTLRTVLLLAQFVALCPSRGSLWHLTGFALRLAIDIGLHWETEEQTTQLPPALLHDRRRLWYSTYQFDRMLCITLGRPFGIIDESTRVPLPDPWFASQRSDSANSNTHDVFNQQAHNHLFSLSKLESEIKHVLHSQTFAMHQAYPKVDYSTWLHDIQPRLQNWCDNIPQPGKAHPSSIFAHQAYWDVIYNRAILLLYRPHSLIQHPSSEALFMSFNASCKLITSIKILQREGKIDVHWRAVHELFIAGLGIIYGLWQSKDLRDRTSVISSISTLQSCVSTLSALSESFSGATGCRDAFETLSTATVEWLLTHDAEEKRQNRMALERQVEDLLQQLQPDREGMFAFDANNNANDVSTMLSAADNFVFSEMLSSNAQWPELEDMDFNGLGYDTMTGAGVNTSWW